MNKAIETYKVVLHIEKTVRQTIVNIFIRYFKFLSNKLLNN